MIVLSPQLGLSPKSILGGEVFDREILLGLAKKGIKIEIVLPRSKAHDTNVKNWHISYLPFGHFPAQFFNLLTVPYLFKFKDADIIRLHQPQFLLVPALLLKTVNPKIKTLATYHKFEETNFGPFSKILNNFWDHIICDSDAVKRRIVTNFRVDASKITVVHNGVPSYLKPASKDKSLLKKMKLEDKTVLLFMGLFIDRKNPLFLIDVLSKLDKNVALLFLGSGPLAQKIIEKAKQQGLSERIKIIDPAFGAEKNKIHNLANIFVHPSIDEGFALAPLEAMACAKPVVITDGYSAREAVNDGVNGFLCRPNDLDHWVGKLNFLIKNPQLQSKTGKAALVKVKKEFNWRLAVEKHLEVLRNLNED